MFLNFHALFKQQFFMFQILISLHSIFRWLVLASLLYAIFKAYKGFSAKLSFTKVDDFVRHWTATAAHIQLIIGIILYSQSLAVKHFFAEVRTTGRITEPVFFGVIHIALMLTAIIIITIGSALSKRKLTDREKFKTMLIWFLIALTLIFLAIPWPFSPLAQRPYLRPL